MPTSRRSPPPPPPPPPTRAAADLPFLARDRDPTASGPRRGRVARPGGADGRPPPAAGTCGTSTPTPSSTATPPPEVQPEPVAPGPAQPRAPGCSRWPTASTRCAGLDLSNVTVHRGRPRAGSSSTRSPRPRPPGPPWTWSTSTSATGRCTAVIYTHSHVDHFAGVRGVIDEADVAAGRGAGHRPGGVPRGGGQRERDRRQRHDPAGHLHVRRAAAQGARRATSTPGSARASRCWPTQGLIAPTEEIAETGTELDGRRRAHRVPAHAGHRGAGGDELPLPGPPRPVHGRELHLPRSTTSTRRGAPRSATRWRGASTSTRRSSCSAPTPTCCFASHHWPRWGADDIVGHLAQPARHLPVHPRPDHAPGQPRAHHRPRSPRSCALPPALGGEFCNRDYYGTVNHNAKAVYQRYLGWFDGNPAHLHPPPAGRGRPRATSSSWAAPTPCWPRPGPSFDDGDYRWVAEVVNHVVFADPTNDAARAAAGRRPRAARLPGRVRARGATST